MMTDAGMVSLTSVKRVLYRHGLKGHSVRRKRFLEKIQKSQMQFPDANMNKELNLWRHFMWSDENGTNTQKGDTHLKP